MKKIISLTLALVLILASTSSVLANSTANGIILDGKELSLDVKPIIGDGTTFIPARALLEALGYNVSWESSTRKIEAIKDSSKLIITLDDSYNNFYNGVRIDIPTKIVNSRTLVPVRFISELLNFDVAWNNESRKVIINSNATMSKIPLSQAHMVAENAFGFYNDPDYSLIYAPIIAATSKEMEEQYYIFLAISEYGFGGGTVYLIDKDTGEAFSFDTMTS